MRPLPSTPFGRAPSLQIRFKSRQRLTALALLLQSLACSASSDDSDASNDTVGTTTVGEAPDCEVPGTSVASAIDVAGGSLELCDAEIFVAAGDLAGPHEFTLRREGVPTSPAPQDRDWYGLGWSFEAEPPLTPRERIAFIATRPDDPRVRGMARKMDGSWEKVSVGLASQPILYTYLSSPARLHRLIDTREQWQNNLGGIGTLDDLYATFDGQPLSCEPLGGDFTNAYASGLPDTWWVTVNCDHFVEASDDDWSLRADVLLDAKGNGVSLQQARMYSGQEGQSFEYVFLHTWMPAPTSFSAQLHDGVITADFDVRVWSGMENGHDLSLGFVARTESFAFTD